MSIELPVVTRHRRDMTEELLKVTLNPNKQQQEASQAFLFAEFHLVIPDSLLLLWQDPLFTPFLISYIIDSRCINITSGRNNGASAL